MINRDSNLMKDGNYLPPFMRDFHAQKRLFKAIQSHYAGRIQEDRLLSGLNWVMAHTYVVDLFLWFMALHGYTLQKSRANEEFYDLDGFLKKFEQEQLETLRQELGRLHGSGL